MLTIEGNEIRFDGEIVGYLIANRATQMVVKDWLEYANTPEECDHCAKHAVYKQCPYHSADAR